VNSCLTPSHFSFSHHNVQPSWVPWPTWSTTMPSILVMLSYLQSSPRSSGRLYDWIPCGSSSEAISVIVSRRNCVSLTHKSSILYYIAVSTIEAGLVWLKCNCSTRLDRDQGKEDCRIDRKLHVDMCVYLG
jgi:hypothetical protein